jgi:hypothetical protein
VLRDLAQAPGAIPQKVIFLAERHVLAKSR